MSKKSVTEISDCVLHDIALEAAKITLFEYNKNRDYLASQKPGVVAGALLDLYKDAKKALEKQTAVPKVKATTNQRLK